MAAGETRRWLQRALRELVAAREDEHEGASLVTARRVDALVWSVAAGVGVLLMPLAPPTTVIGAGGWAVGAGLAAAALVWARRLLDRARAVTFDHLLFAAYVGVLGIGALQWLAGGRGLPYQELFVLLLVMVVAGQTRRRALFFLGAIVVAAFAPLAYDGWDGQVANDTAANALVWLGLGLGGTVLMALVRADRRRSRSGEEEAQRLARVDGLTGLGNRRALDEALLAEIARSRRSESPLSVAIIDMDGLKDINDRLGHLEGDDCLRQVAVTLRDTVRAADRCFRWGGDEFVVLLPDTPHAEAKRVGGRLSTAVRRSCATSTGEPLRISCGCAELGEDGDPIDLMRAADLALMTKKRARRRRRERVDVGRSEAL